MSRQDGKRIQQISLFHSLALAGGLVLLSACSSGEKGTLCEGEMQTLSGQPSGNTEARIVDRFTSFSVITPGLRLESGRLHSANRQQYIPSAVNSEGWLSQRLSDTRFSIINASQDKMITFRCPLRSL